jgi:hypothetical protein
LPRETRSSPDDLDVAPGDTDQDWHFYSVPAVELFGSVLAKIDNPRLAVDSDSLYVAGGYFSFSGFAFQGSKVIRLDKGPLLGGTQGTWVSAAVTGGGRLRPAESFGRDPDDPQLFVEAMSNNSGLRIWQMDTSDTLTVAATLASPFTTVTASPQLGTTARLATHSPHVLNAVWRNGSIWTAHTVKRSTGEGHGAVV